MTVFLVLFVFPFLGCLAWIVARGFQTGRVRDRSGFVERVREPAYYWFVMGFWLFMFCVMSFAAVGLIRQGIAKGQFP